MSIRVILYGGQCAAFYTTPHGWRYMVGIGGVPSIILGILLFWCPESPRQLMYHGRREECERVLRRIYPQGTTSTLPTSCCRSSMVSTRQRR